LTVVFFFVFILVLGLQLWIHFKTQKKLKDLLTPSLFNNVGFQLFNIYILSVSLIFSFDVFGLLSEKLSYTVLIHITS